MFGQHDDDRIDAREMLRPAVPAYPRPARAKDLARLAAYAAETMTIVPLDQASRRRPQGGIRALHPVDQSEHAPRLPRSRRPPQPRPKHRAPPVDPGAARRSPPHTPG